MGKGLRHDPLADIELIRQNLTDRYRTGFPILKELLQNADDAKSTSVEFVWTPGIPTARHPLLKGPGLIAINDGRFTDEDRDAIRMMGLSDKFSQQASIGKFGLGLKSVFHWCEAFLYFARDTADGQVEGDILNPWSGESGMTSFHADWDDFTREDVTVITTHLSQVLVRPSYFGLWIPLRRKEHCSGLAPIKTTFLGDENRGPDFLKASDLGRRFADALPLLVNLVEIHVSMLSANGHLDRIIDIDLSKTELPTLTGEICVREKGVVSRHHFLGNKAMNDEQLETLTASPFWPSNTRINRETAKPEKIPEKADTRAATVFLTHPAMNGGRLEVAWATFLPLGEAVAQPPCPGDSDYTLLLHGGFFVDPGRNRPDFGLEDSPDTPQDGIELRQRWNSTLVKSVVAPQVLPTLASVVRSGVASPIVRNITSAIKEAFSSSDELRRWQPALVQEHQWAYCLSAEGDSWRLLPASSPVVGIPSTRDGRIQISTIFPALRTVADRIPITFADWPRIAPSSELADWPVDSLLAMLDIDVESIFRSAESLEYLSRFLSQSGDQIGSVVIQRKLVSIARTALRRVDLNELRKHRGTVSQFLTLISSELLFPLNLNISSETDAVYQHVLTLQLQVLPIPREFVPDSNQSAGEFSAGELGDVLRTLARVAAEAKTEEQVRVFSDFTLRILEACRTNRREALERFRDLNVVGVYDCKRGNWVLTSWKELSDARGTERIFRDDGSGSRSWAVALQTVLGDERVLLIDNFTASVLFAGSGIAYCTPVTVARLIFKTRSLPVPDRRVPLLSKLLAEPQSDQSGVIVRAIRYLLHSSFEHTDDTSLPLFQTGMSDSSVWRDLAHQALDILHQRWRLIPVCLSSCVAPARATQLHLQNIDVRAVSDLLRNAGPGHIDCSLLSPSDRELVMREISDNTLLQRLVIHEDRSGRLCAIEPAPRPVYLESDYRFDPHYEDLVVILIRSKYDDIADKQRRLLSAWTSRAAIQVALAQPEPSHFTIQILDALSSLGGARELGKELRDKLTSTSWLSGRNREAIAPADLLHLEGLDDEIDVLTAASKGTFASLDTLVPASREHRAFSFVIADLLPSSNDVLEMLGEISREFAEAQSYGIGTITLAVEDLSQFLDAFNGAPPDLMPGLSLIRKAEGLVGAAACVEHLIRGLSAPISVDRLENILMFLSTEHARGFHRDRHARRKIHDLYLHALVQRRSLELIRRLDLLNSLEKWRPVRELCAPNTTGIDESHLINPQQFSIIEPLLNEIHPPARDSDLRTSSTISSERDSNDTATLLRAYFRKWEVRCPRPVIAGFLAVLGAGAVRQLAEDYFDNPGSVDAFRSRLTWKAVPGAIDPYSWGYSSSPHDVMRNHVAVLSVIDPRAKGGVSVQNLLGGTIQVPASDNFESLLLDRIYRPTINTPISKPRTSYITLREIDVAAHSEEKLSSLLRETTRRVLSDAYHQNVTNLDEEWESLHKSEQKEIRVAQNRVASNLFNYMLQYSLHHKPGVANLYRRWDQADRLIAELDGAHGADQDRLREEAQATKHQATERLRNGIAEDTQVQQLFLDAVRGRIERHFQYRLESIPFELFQNADDAVVELETMHQGENLPDEARRFVMIAESSGLTVAHWGRVINQFRLGDFYGRGLGYDADLEKMLMLNASDKGVSDNVLAVTGQFGLGFKSMFLFADRAEVVSGRPGVRGRRCAVPQGSRR